MNALFVNELLQGGFTIAKPRLATDDICAIAFDGALFDGRCVFGHDHPGLSVFGAGSKRHRRTMVARGVCRHAPAEFLIAQRKHGVGRAPCLERANALQVLTFKVKLAIEHLVEAAGTQQRRTVHKV